MKATDNALRQSQPETPTRHALELSIVVPTFNEASNLTELISRIQNALPNTEWEIIFVDDNSPDGTAELAKKLALADRRLRCLRRVGRRGLSSACIEGILASSASFVAVMDADLQHDEAALPTMLESLRSEKADLAIGTRYAEGGSTGDWKKSREKLSRFATRAARFVLPAQVSDPMSGFFMVRRALFDAHVERLSGLGFKILLDLLASLKGANPRIVETPYTFRSRFAGESKLDEFVVWEYGMLLLDKTIGRIVPVRFVAFSLVGGLGVFVHMAALTIFLHAANMAFVVSQSLATGVAMLFNFAVNNALTYRDRRRRGFAWVTGALSFIAVCSVGALANVGIAAFLYESDTQWILAALAGVLVGAVWNFAVTQLFTWKKK